MWTLYSVDAWDGSIPYGATDSHPFSSPLQSLEIVVEVIHLSSAIETASTDGLEETKHLRSIL